MDEFSKIEIKIATDYAKILMGEYEDDKSISNLFSSSYLATSGMNLHLKLGLERGIKRKSRSEIREIIDIVKRLIHRDDIEGNVEILKIKGLDGDHPRDLNLLEELLITERSVTKLDEKTKAVDSNDMYNKIVDSYNSLDDVLIDFLHPIQEE